MKRVAAAFALLAVFAYIVLFIGLSARNRAVVKVEAPKPAVTKTIPKAVVKKKVVKKPAKRDPRKYSYQQRRPVAVRRDCGVFGLDC